MLEAEMFAFVARAEALLASGTVARSPTEQRAAYERFAAAWLPDGLLDDIVSTDAVHVAGDGRAIRLREYRPKSSAPAGTLLFLHGGGFVVGSLDSHALVTARLAADAGLAVIAVDYRLAPEHRAPAAFEDALCIARAALAGQLPFAPLARPLSLAGDSAGGMLAAAVAAALRDECRALASGIDGLALMYPMLGVEPQSPAREIHAHAPLLSLSDVRSYAALYWGDAPPPRATVPLAAARFDRLPPVLAIAAEYDPLYDDARVYVERIRAAGGTAHLLTGRGLVHGFWRALDTSPGAAHMHSECARFLLSPAEYLV